MRSRRAVSGVLALLAAVVVVFAGPAPAMAEDDYANICESTHYYCANGVEAGLVEGQCMTAGAVGHQTSVCVRYDGDHVYVRDGQADGHAAIAEITTLDDGNIYAVYCRNPFGYGSWATCNFDWAETGSKDVSGGYFENRNQLAADYLWRFSNN